MADDLKKTYLKAFTGLMWDAYFMQYFDKTIVGDLKHTQTRKVILNNSFLKDRVNDYIDEAHAFQFEEKQVLRADWDLPERPAPTLQNDRKAERKEKWRSKLELLHLERMVTTTHPPDPVDLAYNQEAIHKNDVIAHLDKAGFYALRSDDSQSDRVQLQCQKQLLDNRVPWQHLMFKENTDLFIPNNVWPLMKSKTFITSFDYIDGDDDLLEEALRQKTKDKSKGMSL